MPIKWLLLAGLALPAMAQAQTAPPPADDRPGEDIIITAPIRQSEADVLAHTSVLTGAELTRDLRPTIGDTLAHQPGVSASSFGPSASRPILRGLQGERVKVLTDGIGAIDVSNTSVDHAVIIDPLLAERVEVLRGPSALLFGPSAIGGVVNVIDTRIPRSRPANGYRLGAIGTYGSAADERSLGAAGDVAVGEHLILHADGSYARSDDLRIGGYALTPQRRAEALATAASGLGDPDIDYAASAAIRGRLPNTAAETWTAGAGATVLTGSGSIGLSYSHYDSLYGVPIRYATQPGQEQEAPRLDIVQNRVDFRLEANVHSPLLSQIRVRAGHASYRHFELEEDGSVGTAFYNDGTEARLELVQTPHGGWQGASGAQYFNRLFDVVGDEAFLPRNETNQTSLFTLQQYDGGRFKAEGGARYELSDVTSRALPDDLRFAGGGRHFSALSGSLGASYGFGEAVRVGLNLSRTERAPSAEELFANGAHAGTQAYELGDPNFRTERSVGAEATLHVHGSFLNIDASAYYQKFRDYIADIQVDQGVCEAAAAPSGRTVDLPCFQSIQTGARYYGFDVEGTAELGRIGGTTLHADLLADYTRASLDDRGAVPRIPPLRLLGGLSASAHRVNGRVEVEHVFDQDRIAAFETPTDGYTVVNASVALQPFGHANATSLTLSANNIFDVDARRATSFLKDFAPLAGRDVRVTLRVAI